MNFSIDQNTRDLNRRIKEFCLRDLRVDDLLHRDQNEIFDRSLWHKCSEFGMQGLPVNKSFAGMELNALDTILALETFGIYCEDEGLSFAVCAHLLSVVVPLWLFGRDHQKSMLLPDLIAGGKISAHAMTEQNSGSAVFNMSTTAIKENGKYLINGTKSYISNAPVADMILVYAMTDIATGILGGVTPFFIERNRAGVSVSDKVSKMGLRTCMMGTITFDNVVASDNDILGMEGGGFKIFQESMNWERIGMSAMLAGNTARILDTVIDRVKHRTNAQQQSITHTLALLKAKLESVKQLTYKAAWCLEHERQSVTMMASSVKLLAGELYKEASLEAVQMMGALGYIADTGIECSHRNAMASTIYSGTSEIQKNIIAQSMNIKLR